MLCNLDLQYKLISTVKLSGIVQENASHMYVSANGVFEFWKENRARWPILYEIAVDVLSCPASTATVERMFSRAGSACSGLRNR